MSACWFSKLVWSKTPEMGGLHWEMARHKRVGGSVLVCLLSSGKGKWVVWWVLCSAESETAMEQWWDESDRWEEERERKGQTVGTERASEQRAGHLITERVLLHACHRLTGSCLSLSGCACTEWRSQGTSGLRTDQLAELGCVGRCCVGVLWCFRSPMLNFITLPGWQHGSLRACYSS